MYVKINNNILTDFADWEFPDSCYADIDYSDFIKNKDKYAVQNNQIIDLSGTQKYADKKRIEEIEGELEKLEKLYYAASQTPVEFEGHQYKFEWTSLYQNILNSGILPAKIWDLTEMEENAVIMDAQTLQRLQTKLLEFQETAFQTKKEARSILLFEKQSLENEEDD